MIPLPFDQGIARAVFDVALTVYAALEVIIRISTIRNRAKGTRSGAAWSS